MKIFPMTLLFVENPDLKIEIEVKTFKMQILDSISILKQHLSTSI